MTPIRLILYIRSLCESTTLTIAQIKARIADVKTSALSSPDGPERGHDIAYYCDLVTAAIVNMEAGVPAWSSAEIRSQLSGRLTTLIPL